MPAVSEDQRRAAAIALRAKRGEMDKEAVGPAAMSMMSMSIAELEKMAHKGGK